MQRAAGSAGEIANMRWQVNPASTMWIDYDGFELVD